MANKNKRINRLVTAGNSQQAADLALIPTLTQPVYFRAEETAESTQIVEHDAVQKDGAATDEDMRRTWTHAEIVNDLEFQLEQSRIRQRGLEKELDVRTEITSSVNEEIREARRQIVAAASDLETLHADYLAVKAALEKSEQDCERLRALASSGEELAEERGGRIQALEGELNATRTELTDLRTYVDGRKDSWHEYEIEISELRRQIARLSDENGELRKAPDVDRESEVRLCRDKIAEQAGELAARKQELETLRKDHARLENYANDLRQRFQDQAETGRDAQVSRQKLEEKLAVAGSTISELNARVEEEQSANQSLLEEQALLQQAFEREVRQIRFELTSAQETIADQESRNEQLASELDDNQEFRRALELHVSDAEERQRAIIKRLKRQVRESREKIAEYESNLRSQDSAIADLTQELAEQNNKIAFTNELETALQKIDGFRPDAKGTGSRPQGRVTRQLIGMADGKELRFPLFRPRLSIGRTAHNDIQLGMRFVSRRHAVIATDNEQTRVIDWGSRNGVFVNNERVTERILESGDVITIGLTDLRYEERQKR
jgi:chromosome segregation ATPase